MRGKVLHRSEISSESRITPAYAGKSRPMLLLQRTCRDHPRVCGEKFGVGGSSLSGLGSPPRMRGKELDPERRGGGERITPAYAGKSVFYQSHFLRWQDHPRVCGEKVCSSKRFVLPRGSPPRMRGKAVLRQCRQFAVGITPAYAGKRMPSSRRVKQEGDHPRVCGEKTKKIP